MSQQGSQRQRTKGNPFKKDEKHLRHKEHRRDGSKANQLKVRVFDTKAHKKTQRAQNGHKQGKPF